MKKSTLLIGMIIGLLACNGLLLFFVLRPHQGSKPEGPKKYIVERLNFRPEQITQYEQLIEEHQKQVRETDQGIIESKKVLFEALNANHPEAKSDSLIQVINTYQAKMEKIHFNHFMALKKLCTPEQIPAFEELTTELGRLFGPKRPPRRGR